MCVCVCARERARVCVCGVCVRVCVRARVRVRALVWVFHYPVCDITDVIITGLYIKSLELILLSVWRSMYRLQCNDFPMK